MIEQPFFVASKGGVIAAVATLPDGEPAATVVFAQGRGATRAGVNRTYALLARSLATLGVASVRADYTGNGESWDGSLSDQLQGVVDVATTSRDCLGAPVLMVSSCYGIGACAAVCEQLPVAATALVAPPTFEIAEAEATATGMTALRLRSRRLARRARDGAERRGRATLGSVRLEDLLTTIVSRSPTLVLMGSLDRGRDRFLELEQSPHVVGHLEVTTVDGVELHGAHDRHAQEAIRSNLLSWVERTATDKART